MLKLPLTIEQQNLIYQISDKFEYQKLEYSLNRDQPKNSWGTLVQQVPVIGWYQKKKKEDKKSKVVLWSWQYCQQVLRLKKLWFMATCYYVH
jgi:hypothetical protein